MTEYNETSNKVIFKTYFFNKYAKFQIHLFRPAAVQSWLEDESTNHGILISVTSLTGEPTEDGIIRFAQRGRHHDTKQPILVTFTDDVTRKTSPPNRYQGN